jgi:hypothetical protein
VALLFAIETFYVALALPFVCLGGEGLVVGLLVDAFTECEFVVVIGDVFDYSGGIDILACFVGICCDRANAHVVARG